VIRSQNIILYTAELIAAKAVIPAPAFAGVNLSPRRRGAGIQKNTGFPRIKYGAGLVKPGMTSRIGLMSLYIICILTIALLFSMTPLMEAGEVHGQLKKKPSLFQETRKDPFSLPSGIRLLSKEISAQEYKIFAVTVTPEAKPAETPLKLKAILIGDHIRLASIDRSIVSIGDFINGEKVLEIRSDRVILEKEGKKRTLVLDQSPIKLTVEER